MTFLPKIRRLAAAAALSVAAFGLLIPALAPQTAQAATLAGQIGLQTYNTSGTTVFTDSTGKIWAQRADVRSSSAGYRTVPVGAMQLVSNPGTTAARTFMAFCVELGQGYNFPAVYADGPGAHLSAAVQASLGRLVTHAWDRIVDARSAAAFQLAVWETIVDSAAPRVELGYDYTLRQQFWARTPSSSLAGVSNIDATTLSMATAWATAARDLRFATASVAFLKSDSSQDIMTFVPSAEPPAPIPLPAAGFALLTALGAMAALRRRRQAAADPRI